MNSLPPIYIPTFITRSFIKKHENDYIFLYSCCANVEKTTGQAGEVLDSNCWGIRIRWSMCKSNGFFQGYDIVAAKMIQDDLDYARYVADNKKPIIPFPNMGEGGSKLSSCAPELFKILKEGLESIRYGNIVYVPPNDGQQITQISLEIV